MIRLCTDTDGDRLDDGEEVDSYGTDPMDADPDADVDTDTDTRTDTVDSGGDSDSGLEEVGNGGGFPIDDDKGCSCTTVDSRSSGCPSALLVLWMLVNVQRPRRRAG